MQPNDMYRVQRRAAATMLLCVVGRVRSAPHQLLVLVTLCTKCEEDVGIFNEETQELHFSKSELILKMSVHENALQWQEKCLPPRAPVISTSPFPLAAAAARAAQRILVSDCDLYRQAYWQYLRTLAQYTENDCFDKDILQPWMFQAALSWLQTPRAAAAGRPEQGGEHGRIVSWRLKQDLSFR